MAHKTVYLIRHGQTSGNREKRYVGRRTDEPLTREGVAAAKRAAEELPVRFGDIASELPRLCTGPQKRAFETAEIFADTWRATGAAGMTSADITVIRELTEIDFGDFEGKNYGELQHDPRYQAWMNSGGTDVFPGGEDREAFIERSCGGFLEALGDLDRDETVVIVCHGGNIMAILSRLSGEDYFAFMTEPLGGYRLELETEDEELSVLAYRRLAERDPA